MREALSLWYQPCKDCPNGDLMLSTKASKEEALVLVSILGCYESISGVIFSKNTPSKVRSQLCQTLE